MTPLPGRARGFAQLLVIFCGLALVGAPAALAQEPEPVPTIPAEPPSGGNPNPDPAPEPPPPSPPPPSSPPPSSPPPSFEPPPSFPSEPAQSGPTQAQIAAQAAAQRAERRQRAREAARRQAAREAAARKKLFQQIRARTKAEAGEGYGLPAGITVPVPPPPVIVESSTEPPALPDAEPVVAQLDQPEPSSAPAVVGGSSGDSRLNGAAPILIGLLGLAVLLLGVAAIPPYHAHGALGVMLVRRRFELGMLGTAVLVSASIGLVIAMAAG